MKPTDLLNSGGFGASDKQAWISHREQAWEGTTLKKIVKGLKLGPLRVVQDAHYRMSGTRQGITLSALDQAYPTLPVRFAAARIPGHRFGEIDDLDEAAFTKCLLYRAYQTELSLDPENEKMLVLVFPWVRDTTRVFYRGTPNLNEPGSGRFWILKHAIYVVDSLVRLLRVIEQEGFSANSEDV